MKESKFFSKSDKELQDTFSFLLFKGVNKKKDVESALKHLKKVEDKLRKREMVEDLIRI